MAGDKPEHFPPDIFFSIERTFLRIYKSLFYRHWLV